MCRSIFALVLLLTPCILLAAPAPKEIWDRPIDPDRDCKFVIKYDKDRTATVELPGTDHDLAPKRGRFNAPRFLREVEGDFVLLVRVSGSFRPSAKSTVDKVEPSVAAGLLLIPADDNCIRLEYGAYRRGGEQRNCAAFRMRGEKIYNMELDWKASWEPDPATEKEAHIYLCLERRGHIIYQAISPDRKKWTFGLTVRVKDLPKKLKVGLAACSTSTEPFKVRFDQFMLLRGERNDRRPNVIIEGKFTP